MLSFRDCAAMSGLTDGEIATVATRRHLPATIAIACAVQNAGRLQRLPLEDTPRPRPGAPARESLTLEVATAPAEAAAPQRPVATSERIAPDETRLGPAGLLAIA